MILQPFVHDLVAALVREFAAAGKPVTPAGRRDELVGAMMSVATGPVTVDEYSGLLAAAFGPGLVPPEVPDDLPLDAVLREGPGVLSDDLLARLALSRPAISDLYRRVEGALQHGSAGECWVQAQLLPDDAIPREYHEAGDRAVEEFRRIERATRPGNSPDGGVPAGSRPPRLWAKVALPVALAASLLLAFYLGTNWVGTTGQRAVRLASVTVRGDATRGIEDVALDVTNGTDRRVFLTVVGLVPGRKTPAYYYRHEGRYIELPPGGTAEVKNLPPEFEGSAVLFLVSTHVPAGGVVRDVTPPVLAPETAEPDADQIRKALSGLGLDADVRVIPLPSKKR